MGGHNLPYPSPIWVGMDDKEILARDAREMRDWRDVDRWVSHIVSLLPPSRSAILPALVMSCAGRWI